MTPNVAFAPAAQQPQQQPAPSLSPAMGAMAPGQAASGQYLAQALQAMGSKPQGNASGLDANLLAQALMQYGQQSAQQGQMQGDQGNPLAGAMTGIQGALGQGGGGMIAAGGQ
jgi:hypothetical protein